MPAGINRVAPGDSGNIIIRASNSADSAGPIEGYRAYLVSPPYVTVMSSGSLLGPISMPPGGRYDFTLHYELDRAAPEGCFRVFVKMAVGKDNHVGVYPDPEDDATPFDFVVLPSTGTRGQFRAKLRAAVGCRSRLSSTEVPKRRNHCRHEIAEQLSNVRASTAAVGALSFLPGDRSRKDAPVDALIKDAQDASIPAILELGYRSDAKSRAALDEWGTPKEADSVLAAIEKDNIFSCDELLTQHVDELHEAAPAVRQALARRGDGSSLDSIKSELNSDSSDEVLYAIAALAYVGDPRNADALKPLLFHPGFEYKGTFISIAFPAMRSLEILDPELAQKIDDESSGPDERLEKWRQWARAGVLTH